MPKSLLQSFLAACALLASVSVMAQTVTDVPLSDADVKIKSSAQNAAQKAAQKTAQSAASDAAKKLPTTEEIAAERARLERMRAALAAERAALEQYKADLVKRQQEAAAAAAKAKADADATFDKEGTTLVIRRASKPAGGYNYIPGVVNIKSGRFNL